MPNDATLKVDGIRDLQKALRQIDRAMAKELAAGLAEAADIVAGAARRKVPVRTGRAAASIKTRKSQRTAALAVGGNKAPYYGWLDFGGHVGRAKSVKRPFLRTGRYIYPTLADKADEVRAKVDEVMARLATDAGFGTTGNAADG